MKELIVCAFIVLLMAIAGSAAEAQQVQRLSRGAGSSRRGFDRAAKDAGVAMWPQAPYRGRGTQVRITFDPRNMDVTLMTDLSYGSERLLSDARSLVAHLGLPKADFIVWSGTETTSVDIEMSDYLARQGRTTHGRIALGKLARHLVGMRLPAPVVIGIEAFPFGHAALTGGGHTTRITEYHFVAADEVPDAAEIAFTGVIPVISYVLWAMIVISPLVLAAAFVIASFMPAKPTEHAPPDPAQVQRSYDRSWPTGIVLVLLAAGPLLFFGMPQRMVRAALSVAPHAVSIPGVNDIVLTTAPIIAMAAAIGFTLWNTRRLRTNQPRETHADERGFGALLPAVPISVAMLLISVLLPPAQRLPRGLVSFAALGILVLGALGTVALSYVYWRRCRRELEHGPRREMIEDLFARAGVRARRTQVVKWQWPNAWVTPTGALLVSQGLFDKLPEDEVRAVVAHEIGHLKCGHHRFLFVVIAIQIALIAGLGALFVVSQRSASLLVIVGYVAISLSVRLVVTRIRRRQEREADRLAVELIGDPELVIRALTAIHVQNAIPHRLFRAHEMMEQHPSLMHRIEAIRAGREP
jgi:Zn-dependent protease with chaperone function